eukprot:801018_1
MVLCRILKINWKKNAQQQYVKTYFPHYVATSDIAEVIFECNENIVMDSFVHDGASIFNRIVITNPKTKRLVMYGKVNDIMNNWSHSCELFRFVIDGYFRNYFECNS